MKTSYFEVLVIVIGICSCGNSTKKEQPPKNGIDTLTYEEKCKILVHDFYSDVISSSRDKYVFPSIILRDSVYILDSRDYFSFLKKTGYFTESYIEMDSLRLNECLDCFNSKKYVTDLEGSFLDECSACFSYDLNRIYGTENQVSDFKITSVQSDIPNIAVTGYCITDGGRGKDLLINCVVDNGRIRISDIRIHAEK